MCRNGDPDAKSRIASYQPLLSYPEQYVVLPLCEYIHEHSFRLIAARATPPGANSGAQYPRKSSGCVETHHQSSTNYENTQNDLPFQMANEEQRRDHIHRHYCH